MHDRSGLVVVGVDGSEASVSALRYALEEARRHDLGVEVVTAWCRPDPDEAGAVTMFPRTAYDCATRAQVSVVARARALAPTTRRVALSGVVVEGEPARIMVGAAHGARSLVLGAPAHAAVSPHRLRDRCVREAGCPVVVVPEQAAGAGRVSGAS